MPYTLSQITSPIDFTNLCPMAHTAWQTPYNPQLKHFVAPQPTRDEAIQSMIQRYSQRLHDHPHDRWWIKVVDSDTGEGVGLAYWGLENGEGDGEMVKATWYPENSIERKFAEKFINGLHRFINARVPRRHLTLHSIVVSPSHRKKGIARMLLRWGTAKADELGVETVVSSLPSARDVYVRCGFGCLGAIPRDVGAVGGEKGVGEQEGEMSKEDLEKWRILASEDLSGWLMWRPVGTDFVEGMDRAPWIVDGEVKEEF